jgi:tol-pal system-associated acyl-CoA thioesterase
MPIAMNPDAVEFSLPLRVYIEDTDAGGIVFYVNYLKYMERARTEFMRSLGLDRERIFNAGLMFVVTRAALDYHLPARLDDELTVTARPRAVRGASLSLEQRVYRRAELLVAGEVTIACVDPRRPAATSHPRGHACYTARRSRRPRRIALEEQLSLIDLVLNAGPTVKLVMAMLLLASVASWFMIVQRFLYFRSAHAEMLDFEDHFWSGVELAQLYREGNEREADGEHIIGMEGLFRAGFKEFSRLAPRRRTSRPRRCSKVRAAPCAWPCCARRSVSSGTCRSWPPWGRRAPISACSVPCGASCTPSAASRTPPRRPWRPWRRVSPRHSWRRRWACSRRFLR